VRTVARAWLRGCVDAGVLERPCPRLYPAAGEAGRAVAAGRGGVYGVAGGGGGTSVRRRRRRSLAAVDFKRPRLAGTGGNAGA
jgi:hypothetical protein